MKKNLSKLKIFGIVLCMMLIATAANSQRVASASGAWDVNATWGGAAPPTAGQTVTINGGVSVSVPTGYTAVCSSITFPSGNNNNSAITMVSGATLTVSGAITIPRAGNTPTDFLNTITVGAGTLNAGSIAFTNAGTNVRHSITISTGTVDVSGSITVNSTDVSPTIAFSGAGFLKVDGALLYNGTTSTGTLTTVAGSTVEYGLAGAQATCKPVTYNGNLTLSGSGIKTFATAPTVNGVLSMEGTATVVVTTGAITYGALATLQYNTATARTATLEEWPAAFAGDGGVVIANTGTITVNAAKTFTSSPLTVKAGATLANGGFTLGSPNALNLECGGTAGSTISGTGVLTLGGNVTVTDVTTGTVGATISCPVALTNGQARTFTIADDGTAATDLTLGGIISTTGSITKAGAGTMVLAGTNTYSGGTTINAGVVSIDETANLGSANTALTIANAATLRTTTTTVILDRPLTLGTGGATFDLVVPLYFQGGSATITGGTGFATSGNDLIINRTLAGNNAIGPIAINGGRVFVFTATSIPNSSVSIASGATLDFNVTGGFTVPATNVLAFASGGGLSNRVGTLTVPAATAGFPTTGTIIFNSDDAATTPISITGNYTTLTGNLTMQVGGGNATVGAVTLGGTLNGGANFDLTKTSTGTLNLGTAAVTLQDLTISGGTLTSTSGTMSVAGNFTNDATFTHNSGLVTLNGTTAQTIGGANPTTFSSLTFNNTLAGSVISVTLSKPVTVNTGATFTDGIVLATATNFLAFPDGATVGGTGLSQTTDASFVVGPVRKTGNDGFIFPVGALVTANGGGYMPLTITAPNELGDIFSCEYTRNNATAVQTNGFTLPIINVSRCDYWNLDEIADPGNNNSISVTLSWDAGSACNANTFINNFAALTVAHYNSGNSKWEQAGTGGPAPSGSNASGTVTRTGVSVFSPFSLGNTLVGSNPLPVTFSDVKAFEKGTGVQLEWSNLTEKDMVNYVIERSSNGVNFSAIGTVAPRSNSNDKESYTGFDAAPFAGSNFYRIKTVEIDGKITYSKLLKVDIGRTVKGIALYPNPVVGTDLSVSLTTAKGQFNLVVYNNAGQQVYSKQLNLAGGTVSQSIELPKSLKTGVYNLSISGDNYKETKTFILQ